MMAITWRRLGSLMMMMMAIVFFGIAEGAWRGKKSDANSEHLQVPSPVSDEVPAIMCDVRIVTGDERRRAGKLGVGAGRGNLSLEISPNLPSLHQTDNGGTLWTSTQRCTPPLCQAPLSSAKAQFLAGVDSVCDMQRDLLPSDARWICFCSSQHNACGWTSDSNDR